MFPCKHENVRFDAPTGSFYVKCCHCEATWMAIDPVNDTPRYEAMRESYGLTEERRAPFYTPAYTQYNQLQNALNILKITTTPTEPTKIHVNLEEALAILFGRPQADLLKQFEDKYAFRYIGKLNTRPHRDALLADAKAFIQQVARTHTPR